MAAFQLLLPLVINRTQLITKSAPSPASSFFSLLHIRGQDSLPQLWDIRYQTQHRMHTAVKQRR